MSRNVIIAVVAIVGLCACGACLAVFGGFALLGPATSNVLATVQALPSALPSPFVLPTIPGNATPTAPVIVPRLTPSPSGPLGATSTPPIILQRGTPTVSISRGTPTSGASSTQVVFTDNFSGKCNLPEIDDDKHTFKCENNSYTMVNKMGTSRWVYYTDADYATSSLRPTPMPCQGRRSASMASCFA